MKQIMKKILKDYEAFISGIFLCVTVTVVVINVILRYLFQGGLFWVEEVATACFIWSIFIGAAGAYRYKMHIGIDLITKLFPEKIREIISTIINLIMIVLNTYIVYLSFRFIIENKLKRTPVLALPASYVNAAITVGFSLMTIQSVRFFIQELKLFLNQNNKVVKDGGE